MKIAKFLVQAKLVRSGAEAQRTVKQGAVSVGGCDPDCSFFKTGKCTCGGWAKVANPAQDVPAGTKVKVGSGLFRLEKRLDGRAGYDQLNGIAEVPEAVEDSPENLTCRACGKEDIRSVTVDLAAPSYGNEYLCHPCAAQYIATGERVVAGA